MRALSLLAASVMAVVVTACAAPAPREFGKKDTDNINQLIREFVTIYNAKDAAKLSALFMGDGAVLPPNASTVRGVENVRDYYVNRFARGASDLALESKTVAGSGTLAFAEGDYRLSMAPAGGTVRRDRGKFIFILRDLDGKWRLDHLMFSSDFAPETSTN